VYTQIFLSQFLSVDPPYPPLIRGTKFPLTTRVPLFKGDAVGRGIKLLGMRGDVCTQWPLEENIVIFNEVINHIGFPMVRF
jgi:hypothetical protein